MSNYLEKISFFKLSCSKRTNNYHVLTESNIRKALKKHSYFSRQSIHRKVDIPFKKFRCFDSLSLEINEYLNTFKILTLLKRIIMFIHNSFFRLSQFVIRKFLTQTYHKSNQEGKSSFVAY